MQTIKCPTCPACKIELKTENRTYTMPSGGEIAKIERVTGMVKVCPSCNEIYIPDKQTINLSNITRQLK